MSLNLQMFKMNKLKIFFNITNFDLILNKLTEYAKNEVQ